MLTSPNFVCATVVFKHGARKVSCKRSSQGKSFSPWKDKSFETWILFDELSLSFSRVSFQRFAAMPLAQPRGPRQRWVCIGLLAIRAKWHTPLIDCAWIKDYYPLIFVNSSLIHLEKRQWQYRAVNWRLCKTRRKFLDAFCLVRLSALFNHVKSNVRLVL